MLIQNYGRYWSANRVFWGYAGVQGTLLGVPHSGEKSIVDFRDQRAVYVLYDNLRPIYVGQAGGKNEARLFGRLRKHRKDHLAGRWDTFSWFGVIPVTKRGKKLRKNYRIKPGSGIALNHIEAILITAMEPVLNRQGGKFGRAREYLQFDDEHLPDDLQTTANEILDRLERLERRAK